MAEVGGKSLSADIRAGVAAARRRIDELKIRAAGALTEFSTEAGNVEKAVKQIEAETLEMRQVANDLLGNNPPETDKP